MRLCEILTSKPLQQKTENVRDTNVTKVTFHYRRKLRVCEILIMKKSITKIEKNDNTRDTITTIHCRNKQLKNWRGTNITVPFIRKLRVREKLT